MSEPKFTPGPWHSDDYGYVWSGERSDAHLIAEVRGWGWIQYLPNPEQIQDANRDLIAAAPDLYRLLDEALSYTGCESWSPSLTDEIKAALAKARGEG